MKYRRKKTLVPSTMTVLRSMGIKVWTDGERVYHNGDQELRDEIAEQLSLIRETGPRGAVLYFLACVRVAMNRGCWSEDDVRRLDPLGVGNIGYWLPILEGSESNA